MKKMNQRFTVFLALLCMAFATTANAQWAFNGANIFNTNAGNVGIGTNAPATKLEILDASPTLRVRSNNAPNPATIESNASGVVGVLRSTITPNVEVRVGSLTNNPLTLITNNTDRIFLGTDGNVGIGIRNPLVRLQVQGGNVAQITSGALGDPSAKWSVIGAPPSAFPTGGEYYGYFVNWAQQNFVAGLLDNGTNKDGLLAWQDQTSTSVTAGTRLRIGFIKGFGIGGANPAQFSEKMTVLANGNVGIGTSFPTARLVVSGGNLRIGSIEEFSDFGGFTFGSNSSIVPTTTSLDLGSNANPWDNCFCNSLIETSDGELKEDIKNSRYGLEHIMKLRPVTYKMKEGRQDAVEIGLIAQEVSEVIPEVVHDPAKQVYLDEEGKEMAYTGEGNMSVQYTRLIPVLIQAMQELKAENEELKERLEAVEGKGKDKKGDNAFEEGAASGVLLPKLYQNSPNPFTQETRIAYELPEEVANATLFIFDMNGKPIRSIRLSERGKGEVQIAGSELQAGMYIYSLIADNKEIDTRRMILTE